jgi:3-mercaptopyruvate sulfurtransferase SseA
VFYLYSVNPTVNLVMSEIVSVIIAISIHVSCSQLPHMLPSERAFAAAVSALGIENKDKVIIYDGLGIFSAARVWW